MVRNLREIPRERVGIDHPAVAAHELDSYLG
jgi:hypothetical protein